MAKEIGESQEVSHVTLRENFVAFEKRMDAPGGHRAVTRVEAALCGNEELVVTGEPLQQAAETIRRLATAQEYFALPDADLLAHFNRDQDHTAFEVLVRRHGPMILGVCRRMLSNSADVEDAFQAVFLVLLRKASSIKRPKLLGNWLFGVAYHTARAARAANQKRRVKEDAVTPRQADPMADNLHELTEILDEELARLPQAHREVLLLCDLQEVSRKEAANKLNIAEGTLSSRLSRARTMLAARLKRRGIQSSLPIIEAGFGSVAAPVTVPPALIQVAVHAGLASSAGAAGEVSMQAIKLSEAAIKMMLLSKLKILVPAVALGIGLCAGWQVLGALGKGVGGGESSVAVAPVEQRTQSSADVKALIKQSTQAIALIEDEELRLDLLVKLGWTQFRLGERAEALATGRQALGIAQALVNDDRKANTLCDIAGLLLESGDRKTGMEVFRLAENLENKLTKAQEQVSHILDRGVVAKLCAHGEFDEALRVMLNAPDKQNLHTVLWNLTTYAPISYRKGKSSAALKGLRDAREFAIKLGDEGKVILANMAGALAQMGQVQEAMQTLDSISKPDPSIVDRFDGFRNIGMRNVVRGLAGRGDWQNALKVYDAMRASKQHYDNLSDIAAAQINAGRQDEVKLTIQKLRSMVNAPENRPTRTGNDRNGGRDSVRSTGTVLAPVTHPDDILARVGVLEARLSDFPKALQTTLGLTASLEKARALLDIAQLQQKAGEITEARKTLRKASRSAEIRRSQLQQRGGRSSSLPTEAKLRRKDSLLQAIARAQAALHDLEGAEETLGEISTEQMKGPAVLLELKTEAGDFEGAIALLPQIKKASEKGYTLETMTQTMAKAGEEKAARKLANQQSTPALKVYALLGILSAKLPAERAEE